MAPITYSGALQPKKKSELQDIALALHISDQGTKDEIQARIKKHLDANTSSLEDDPTFAGLYGRRRRSAQPQLAPPTAASEKPRSSNRIAALDPIRETTPVKDLPSPAESKDPSPTPYTSPRVAHKAEASVPPTPSSLPPLPESPIKSIVQAIPKPNDVIAAVSAVQRRVVQQTQREILPHGTELVEATRAFLSNSRNIWTLSSLFEALYIISTVIPWKYAAVPLSPTSTSPSAPTLAVPYPPLSVFQTSTFWLVLLHWAIPTLIAPAFVGNLISFNPTSAPTASTAPEPRSTTAVTNKRAPTDLPFDPLTAAIVRLAAAIAYPYASFATKEHIFGLDVLGYNLRVFNASLGLAFAFAEAIQGAPRSFAKTLAGEQRLAIQSLSASRGGTPVRGFIGEAGESSEVD